MQIILAVLLAIAIVLILYMISTVYQMGRDNRTKFTKLTQKQLSLEHKVVALESIVTRMREADYERRTDVSPDVDGGGYEPDTGTEAETGQADTGD